MSTSRSVYQRRIAQSLRDLRKQSGLSQEALADRAKVHRTYVGLLERGEREPRLSSLGGLLAALGVTWEEFGRRLDGADRRR